MHHASPNSTSQREPLPSERIMEDLIDFLNSLDLPKGEMGFGVAFPDERYLMNVKTERYHHLIRR